MSFVAHIVREIFWWIVDLSHEFVIGKLGRWFAWLISLGRWIVDDESVEPSAIGWCVLAGFGVMLAVWSA